ncbi:unnamed protein product [Discula destructiva]
MVAARSKAGFLQLMSILVVIFILIGISTLYVSPEIIPNVYSLARPKEIDVAVGPPEPGSKSSFKAAAPKTPISTHKESKPAVPIHHDMCVATRVHEEAHNLIEWIEYHHVLGFTKFFIHDDCSKDETWEVLQRYASIGLVEPLTHEYCEPNRVPYEQGLIDAAFQAARAECDWVAVFDVDEFITQQTDLHNGTLLEWAQALDPQWPYMRMVWQVVGNDGRIFPTDTLLTHTYTHGDYRPQHFKTFIKTEAVIQWGYSLWPTQFAGAYEHVRSRLVDLVKDASDTRFVDGVSLPSAPFFLNHFVVKSLLEFLAVRSARIKTSNGEQSPWHNHPLESWSGFNIDTPAIGREWTRTMADKTAAAMAARPWPKVNHARFYFGPEPMGFDDGWMDGRVSGTTA